MSLIAGIARKAAGTLHGLMDVTVTPHDENDLGIGGALDVKATIPAATAYYVYEGAVAADATPPTAFVVAGTGWEINCDINAALGTNAKRTIVACDGGGNIVAAWSTNDGAHLGAAFTIEPGEERIINGSLDSLEINGGSDNVASYVRVYAE